MKRANDETLCADTNCFEKFINLFASKKVYRRRFQISRTSLKTLTTVPGSLSSPRKDRGPRSFKQVPSIVKKYKKLFILSIRSLLSFRGRLSECWIAIVGGRLIKILFSFALGRNLCISCVPGTGIKPRSKKMS